MWGLMGYVRIEWWSNYIWSMDLNGDIMEGKRVWFGCLIFEESVGNSWVND